LRVSNAGPTIPPQELQSLTRRLARRDRNARGSGLGLAIVQAIADGTGGRLELRSPATGREDGFTAALYPQRP